jgi:TRAP-type uncharacterized transport system substrate-binding protein
VAGLSTGGVLSTLGCLGGDSRRLSLGVGPVGSRSHTAGKALSVAADRHAEGVTLGTESVEGTSERLYGLSDGRFDAAAVDNTTLYRAIEGTGVFDLDGIETVPAQGFSYGWLDHYWLTASDAAAGIDSTGDVSAELTVYPVQPGMPSRLVTEQLLRAADRWESIKIDNRPRTAVPEAVDGGEIDIVTAVEPSGQTLAPWCQQLDDRVGDRLAALPVGDGFESAIEDAPNAVGGPIEPTGWERADLPSEVDGWRLPMQWLVAPDADSEAVAELTRIAAEHSETIRSVDEHAVAHSEPAALAAAVIEDQPVHEGVATAFKQLDIWDDDWTEADAVD